MHEFLYIIPCTAYCTLSAHDNGRVGAATHSYNHAVPVPVQSVLSSCVLLIIAMLYALLVMLVSSAEVICQGDIQLWA